ncbi:MAG: hypothetical protein OEW87_06500, partial [Flavobacteriaceae bacterium]|nr:hypothetical protein [Flavobacteriaceae bacterium]
QVDSEFFDNGRIKSEYDSISHKYVKYFENGNIELVGYKYFGLLHDSCKYYYENGEVHKFGKYYYGRQVGGWTEYDGIGIKAWKYPEPKLDSVPKTKANLVEETDTNNWRIVARKKNGAEFFIMPFDAFGNIQENISLISVPQAKEFKKIQNFVNLMKDHYSKNSPSFMVLSEKRIEFNGIEGIDIICTIKGPKGEEVTFWSRSFMDTMNVYQLTLNCESSQMGRLTNEVEQIFGSFQFNK